MVARARRVLTITVLLALGAAAFAASEASSRVSVDPTLYVQYAMNCTFTIATDAGGGAAGIAPGSYQVQVTTPVVFADVNINGLPPTDMTACQSFIQFQLTGPGVSIATTLQDGDEDYGLLTATFQAGTTYTATDLNQPSVARVSFTTASSGTATASGASQTGGSSSTGKSTSGGSSGTSAIGTSIASDPLRGTLEATVPAAGAPKLTYKGKPVTSLKAGRYTISVVDRSKQGGFILQAIQRSATTVAGASFVGKRSVSVDLRAGQWFFYPTFVAKKTYFIVVG